MKKLLTAVIVIALAAGAAAANGTQESAAKDAGNAPYTIQVLTQPTTITSYKDTVVGKVIFEKFGINFEPIPYAGDMREKQSLMLAAKDYGELVYMEREDMVLNYVKAGALLQYDQYLPRMPSFTARYKDLIPYWRLSGDGKLYKWEVSIPRHLDSDLEVNDMMVRTDALEAAGWKIPLSADQWIAFLKEAVKTAKDADGKPATGITMPMAESWGLSATAPILYEKGDTYQEVSGEGYTYNLKTKLFEDFFLAPPVKDSMRFFNRCHQAGLLDEECFTDTNDKTQEKMNKARSVTAFYVTWCIPSANVELAKAGKESLQYINLPIQSNAQVAAKEKREIRVEASRPYDSWGLTTKCTYPERVMKLWDYLASDEGQILIRNGVEGVHWTKKNGKRVATETLQKAVTDKSFNATQGIIVNGVYLGMPQFNLLAADGQPHDVTLEQSYIDGVGLTERARAAYKSLGWKSSKSWYMTNGFLAPSGLSTAVYVDPASELGKLHTKMVETRVKYFSKLILANNDAEFESIWQDAVASYKKLKPETVIDEFNRLIKVSEEKLEQYKKM